MNTPVNFEIAKLLKEKEFDEYSKNAIGLLHNDVVSIPPEFGLQENDYVIYGALCNSKIDEFNSDYISAPTIAEVVMWLYEKHEIWIAVTIISHESWQCYMTKIGESLGLNYNINSNSPTEAYSQAIIYTLKNLI